VTTLSFHSETGLRRARMLRTAMGSAMAGVLEDPSLVEVMLNLGGQLWIDRLSSGLTDTGETLSASDGEPIIRLSLTVSASRSMQVSRAFQPNCLKPANASRPPARTCRSEALWSCVQSCCSACEYNDGRVPVFTIDLRDLGAVETSVTQALPETSAKRSARAERLQG
jgi:hypothetical protein